MSREYYVRDRGRIMGPFSQDQLFDMRDRGLLQAYHEVSLDQRTWKAFDLMFAAAAAPTTVTTPQPNPNKGRRPPPPAESNRTSVIIIASVIGLVAVAGLTIAGYLIFRSKTTANSTADGDNPTDKVPAGLITFTSRHSAEERYRVLKKSVCWVVLGKTVRLPNGDWYDVPRSTGSGFCVTEAGHVVTNQHVVDWYLKYRGSVLQRAEERELNAKVEPKIWVFFGQEDKHEIEEVHASENYDVAVIKIPRKAEYYFAMCETEDDRIPMQDQKVVTAGFPSSDQQAQEILFGKKMERPSLSKPIQRYFQDADFEVTREEGDLKRKPMRGQQDKAKRESWYINHTARIAKGNSGGPLVTHDGTVLGINTLGVPIEVNDPGAPGGKRYVVQEGQNYALTMQQLRRDIERHVPGGGNWRQLAR